MADQLSLEAFRDILAMTRTPQDEAGYLLDLYQNEAAEIIREILNILRSMGRYEFILYWEDAGNQLKLMRH